VGLCRHLTLSPGLGGRDNISAGIEMANNHL
jgi:hypothetical protein